MIPPARDPRMDRGVGRAVVTVAASAVDGRAGRTLLIVAFLLGVGLAFSLPRAVAYSGLVDENLALKGKLEQVDHTMGEVDRILSRLRLYDAQLRSLSEARGAHGPIPDVGPMSGDVSEYADDLEDDALTLDAPMLTSDDVLDGTTITSDDLRPADAWAADIADRVTGFVDQFDSSEAELAALMADLEALRSIHQALPAVWPSEGEISSGFGWRRDPIRRYTKFHSGLDIANDPGTPIEAVADGTVVRAEMTSGYGNMVDIDHGFGIVTRYGHCSALLVAAGDHVQRGDPIALMGSTGRSTGPHVHFEIRIDGSAQDPLKYLPR